MKLKCSACYPIDQLNPNIYNNNNVFPNRSPNFNLPLSPSSSNLVCKTKNGRIFNKGCSCIKKFGNWIKCAELGTIFYGIISLILHIISVVILVDNLKQLIISMVVDLSLNIPNDISQYGLVNTEYKFILLNKTNQNNEPTREYIFNQFLIPIIFLSMSIFFAIFFAINTFFKTGNLANDDVNLGNDLILFEDHKKNLEFSDIKTFNYKRNQNDGFQYSNNPNHFENHSINNQKITFQPVIQANKLKTTSNSNNLSFNKINIIYEQDELDENIHVMSKSSSPSLSPPLSSPLVSSSRSSSSPPLSTSSSSLGNFSKPNEINRRLINNQSNKIPKKSSIDYVEPKNSFIDKSQLISTYINFNNSTHKPSLFLSYLPSTCSCFHLLMCFSLLLSRLYLNKFKINYDLAHKNPNNNDKLSNIAKILSNTNFSNSNFEDNLHFIYFFHENTNKTSKINTLFEEVNLSLKRILSPVSDIVNFNLDSSILVKNNNNNTTNNFLDTLIDIGNLFHINLNYLNYLLAFLVFTFKSTRVYSTMNRLYAFLVFIHLMLFTCLNFTAFPAFEILFKSNDMIGYNYNNPNRNDAQLAPKTTSTSTISYKVLNSTLNMPEYFSLNSAYNNSNDSITITIPNSNLVLNMNLNINSFIPSLFNNEYFVLGTFLTSWLLNLIYLSSLNIFAISFYREAQLKIKLKYKKFLMCDTNGNQISQHTNSNDIDDCISKKTDDFLHVSKCVLKTNNTLPFFADQKNFQKMKLRKNSKLNKKEQYQVINQYKAIIVGIFIFLLTETFRFPFVYSCYIKYFLRECNTFLIALMSQLIYLMFNALFWIILSFKTQWDVKFTRQFRILLWHQIYIEYLYKLRNNNLLMKFNSITNSKHSDLNRTSSTRVESDSKVSFDAASITSYINLNSMHGNKKRCHSADCNLNLNSINEILHDPKFVRKPTSLIKFYNPKHSQSQSKLENSNSDTKLRHKSYQDDNIFTVEHEEVKINHKKKPHHSNYLMPLSRESNQKNQNYKSNIDSSNSSERSFNIFRKNELSTIEANNSNGYISVPTYSFTCQTMNESESESNLLNKILNINQLSSHSNFSGDKKSYINNQKKIQKKCDEDFDIISRNSNDKLVDLKLKHLNAKNSNKAKLYFKDFHKELNKSSSSKNLNREDAKIAYSDLKKDLGKRDIILSSRRSSVY